MRRKDGEPDEGEDPQAQQYGRREGIGTLVCQHRSALVAVPVLVRNVVGVRRGLCLVGLVRRGNGGDGRRVVAGLGVTARHEGQAERQQHDEHRSVSEPQRCCHKGCGHGCKIAQNAKRLHQHPG